MTTSTPMIHCYKAGLLLLAFFLFPTFLKSQDSKVAAYQKAIQQSIEAGTFNGFDCSHSDLTTRTRSTSRAATCSEVFDVGYGTNCWNDTNTTPDPACAIPPVAAPECNGGFYRIPIAITIFECTNWNGANYLSGDGSQTGGFEPLQDVDLTNRLNDVNNLYANANIEFYEVQRRRVEDCNLYDFFTNVDPATGVNELNQTALFDVPNAINIYFVGGINRDHDCCGTLGFAPYPPSRDYMLLRYGAGVTGSNLAHELGHYFGLPHTYATSVGGITPDTDGIPVGALDNCDCLTTGDKICDTWPDPFFSHNCNHDGGTGGFCYIKRTTESFCEFDEEGYKSHILASHPGAPDELLISPNSGTVFSSTSSTVLNQNIMTNNLFFGCTTTFSPCQYRKIHDVARAGCRNYLCRVTVADYFQSTTVNAANTTNYEICAGDPIPTFTAGTTVTRFDGTTYELDCFNWYLGEFDAFEDAILFNSTSYTPPTSFLGNNMPGVYEFWVAESNALNDVPCKVKVTLTISEDAGVAIYEGTNANTTIDTCGPAILNFESVGSTIESDNDMIGWYFSSANPLSTLLTDTAITDALTFATNSTNLNATTGNIIQSNNGDTLTGLDNLTIDCNTLGDGSGTYYLTPFVASGDPSINCSASGNSQTITVINFEFETSDGTILNIDPITDCTNTGELADYSVTISINECDVLNGPIGLTVDFNCESNFFFNSNAGTFDCSSSSITLTKEQIATFYANDPDNPARNFDPIQDRICLSFVDNNFLMGNAGNLTLNATARVEATYVGESAKEIWDRTGQPPVNTANPSCFWGTPIAINCNCTEVADCPSLSSISGTTNLCSGDLENSLTVTGINNIGNFDVQFVYFNTQQIGAEAYGTPDGILGTVSNAEMIANNNQAVLENISYPVGAGTYFVYARLSPIPGEVDCRPFLEFPVTILPIPAAPIVSDTSYCENEIAAALSAQGSNLLWYTTATGGIGSNTAPTPTTSTAGDQEYWVTQSVNGCESSRSKITVTVISPPAAPQVSDTTYCENALAVALTAEGVNLLWYTAATGGTGSTTAPVPTTSTAGDQEYWVTQSVNGCESSRSKITVTVISPPAVPQVSDTTYCENALAIALTAEGVNLLWYTAATGGTGSTTALVPTTNTAGDQEYWVTQSVNGCESNRSKITVTVNPQPAAPLVSDTTYCENDLAIALTAEGVNLLWYTAATGGIGSTTAPTPTTNTAGDQEYWVTQSVNGCESNRSKITVTVNPQPAAPIVSDTSYCQNTFATALTAQGTNLLWYNVETGGIGIATAPTPTTNTIGIQEYWVTQSINGCESIRSKIIVEISAFAVSPIVSDINYCQDEIATILTAQGTNLLWYSSAIGGTGSTTAPTPTTSTAGTQEYWVTQNLNGCESIRSKITVTIHPIPAAPIVLDTSYCQDAVAATLSAEGSNLLWYTAATGGTGSTTAPTPTTSTVGVQAYWVTQSVNGCESQRVRIRVTIQPAIELTIASFNNPSSCAGSDGSINLSGLLTSTSYTLAYQFNDSIYVQSFISDDNGGFVINNLSAGLYESITVSNDLCASSSLNQELNDPSIADVTSMTVVSGTETTCLGESISIQVNIAGGQSPYTIEFFDGSNSRIIHDFNTGDLVEIAPTQTTTYSVLAIMDSNNCTNLASASAVTITVNPIPTAPSITNMTVCQNDPIGGLSVEGENLLWYEVATGGIGVSFPPIVNTANIGVQEYWVSQTINGCESPRAVLTIMIVEKPTPPSILDRTLCMGDVVGELLEGIPNVLWYDTQFGGFGLSLQPTISTNVVGSTTYWVSQTIGGCESDRSPITITVNPLPSAPLVNNVMYCVGDSAIQLVAMGINLTWYSESNGTGSTLAPVPPTINADTLRYWVTQTINGCESGHAVVTVTVEDIPSAPLVTDISYCVGDTPQALTAVGNQLQWYTQAIGGNVSASLTPTTTTVGTQTYWVSQIVGNCESDRASLTVSINEKPLAPITKDTTYCVGDTPQALMAVGNQLQWYESATSSTPLNGTPTPTTNIAGSTTYWVSQSNNGCESDRASSTITVIEKPTILTGIITNPTNTSTGSIQLTGLTPNTNYILLYEVNGVEEQLTITTDASGNYVLTNLSAGQYTISVALGNNTSNTITVNLESEVITCPNKPAPPIVQHATYCVGDAPVPLKATGENIRWYITPTGTSGTGNPPIPTTDLPGRYQFWVSQTVEGCESDRVPFIIRVKEVPTPAFGLVILPSICGKDGSIQLTGLEANTEYYLAYSQNGFPRSSYITTSPLGTYTLRSLTSAVYTIDITINGCGSASLQYDLTNSQTPLIGKLTGTTTICNGAFAVLNVDIQGGVGPYTVYFTDGRGHYAYRGYNGTSMTLRPSATTTYTLIGIQDATGCYGTALPEEAKVTVQRCSGK